MRQTKEAMGNEQRANEARKQQHASTTALTAMTIMATPLARSMPQTVTFPGSFVPLPWGWIDGSNDYYFIYWHSGIFCLEKFLLRIES